MGDLGQEKCVDLKDLKTLPIELNQDFTAFLVKPPNWSVEDWQEEWSQKVVADKLSNTLKVLDYMWKGEIFFEETIIPGPSDPAQTLRKSLTEMLSGAEDSQQSKDLTEKLEDHYETGPSILIIIHE